MSKTSTYFYNIVEAWDFYRFCGVCKIAVAVVFSPAVDLPLVGEKKLGAHFPVFPNRGSFSRISRNSQQ